MYDNLKNAVSWIFTLGIVELFIGLIHLEIFPRYINTNLAVIPSVELMAASVMVYWSFMMTWVLMDTPDKENES
jgi:hypothetical protein